jgi:DNA-dependent protein kinase catalytic subunit
MSSVRKPKRIKFYGSDGRESMFLVKGGEDLRNDERVELLFDLMNSIVASSMGNSYSGGEEGGRSCSLRARTYTVIPMTSKV